MSNVPPKSLHNFIFPLTECHFPTFSKYRVLYFLVAPRGLEIPEQPWRPKSVDTQVLYIKWCIAVRSASTILPPHIQNLQLEFEFENLPIQNHVGVSVVKFCDVKYLNGLIIMFIFM